MFVSIWRRSNWVLLRYWVHKNNGNQILALGIVVMIFKDSLVMSSSAFLLIIWDVSTLNMNFPVGNLGFWEGTPVYSRYKHIKYSLPHTDLNRNSHKQDYFYNWPVKEVTVAELQTSISSQMSLKIQRQRRHIIIKNVVCKRLENLGWTNLIQI